VVSRGGRPDLAADALAAVQAPTLLIVGGDDETVIELNEQAKRRMHAVARLEIVPGATHLFEEEGALEQVERLASEWFQRYLPRHSARRGAVDMLDGVVPGEK
jgi:pimeloyl-ACP methyl ester carboxylesterase